MSIVQRIIFLVVVQIAWATFKYGDNPCGELFFTQSPKGKKNLTINWNFSCEDPPDSTLVTNRNGTILYQIYTESELKGHQETPFSVSQLDLPGNWSEGNKSPDFKNHCFDYNITSRRNNSIVYTQCLSIQPTWMSHFPDARIGDLMIPGTHNSGAWTTELHLMRTYVLNQDKSFWHQLVYGIRYFDLRVGFFKNCSFYLTHNVIKCTPLLPELESVLNFLRISPTEIVILDFHHFTYPIRFNRTLHLKLIDLVKTIFGDLIFPFKSVVGDKGPKLKEFLSSGRRLIVSYNEVVPGEEWLWPGVKRDWGNKITVEELEEYIGSVASSPVLGNPLRVLMAELTPNYFRFGLYLWRDLGDLAMEVNPDLSGWLRRDNRSDNLNIVATDFFTGNDVINVAIATNYKKCS